jgi:hypothetical protein
MCKLPAGVFASIWRECAIARLVLRVGCTAASVWADAEHIAAEQFAERPPEPDRGAPDPGSITVESFRLRTWCCAADASHATSL